MCACLPVLLGCILELTSPTRRRGPKEIALSRSGDGVCRWATVLFRPLGLMTRAAAAVASSARARTHIDRAARPFFLSSLPLLFFPHSSPDASLFVGSSARLCGHINCSAPRAAAVGALLEMPVRKVATFSTLVSLAYASSALFEMFSAPPAALTERMDSERRCARGASHHRAR